MSYILDALKKAAEQREQQTPGVRRLIAPAATRGAARFGWRSPVVIALSLGAVAAIALAVVALLPAPDARPAPAPEAARPAPVVARPPVVATPVGEPPKPAAVVATAEAPRRAVVATVTEAPKRATAAVAGPARPPAVTTPAEPPRAPARVEALRPQRQPAPVALSAPRRRVVNPEDPEGAMVEESPVKLKLEVLVYSDVAAERMVFINGRKYKQGDTVAERARIEEIQPDSVVLSEEGRRFTLRQ